jgi:electron transfer flavoprotein beta subunit
MGADDGILVDDSALENLDTQGAARVLAAAIQKIGGADLVVFGRQTLDNGAGLTPAQTARILGWPMLGLAGQIKVDGGSVTVDRVIEEGRQTVSAKLPAVLASSKVLANRATHRSWEFAKPQKQKFPCGH